MGRLTASSNNYGLSLEQFSKRTGVNLDLLQRWEALMRRGGVGAEETMKSFEGLQQVIAKIATGEGVPAGFGAIANVLGPQNFDPSKARDMGYLLDKLRDYAVKTKDIPDIRNRVMAGLGLTPNFVAELSNSQVKLSKIRPSEIYSQKEINALANMAKGWAMLGNEIQKTIGRLNIQFGPRFLADMQRLVPQIERFVRALAKFAETIHLMEGVGKVFQGWAMIFKEMTDAVNTFRTSGLKAFLPTSESAKFFVQDLLSPVFAPPNSSKVINNNVNTTVNVEGGTGQDLAQEIGKVIGRQFNNAFRNVPQGGGI